MKPKLIDREAQISGWWRRQDGDECVQLDW